MLKKITWWFTALQSWSTTENFAVSQEFLKYLLQTQLEFSTSLPISFILLEHQQLSNKKKKTSCFRCLRHSVTGSQNFISHWPVVQLHSSPRSPLAADKRYFDAWDSVANLHGCWIILDTLWGVTLDPYLLIGSNPWSQQFLVFWGSLTWKSLTKSHNHHILLIIYKVYWPYQVFLTSVIWEALSEVLPYSWVISVLI